MGVMMHNPGHSLVPVQEAELTLHPALAVAPPPLVERFGEFFGGTIRNPNTRAAYMHAVRLFLDWCADQGLGLRDVRPLHVAAYVEALTEAKAAATAKQHLAGIRGMFGHLVTGGMLEANPAADVRGPANVYRKGKSPVLFEEDVRQLLEAVDTCSVIGLRDRAFLGVMLYSFARVSAVCAMRVQDYEVMGSRAYFILEEKGGIRSHRVPAHHRAREFVEAYIDAGGLADAAGSSPLFRSTRGRCGDLSDRGLDRTAGLRMVKRRCSDAKLPASICNHSFRASGITAYMQQGGGLETAASIAGHASTRTTQLYNRNPERVEQSEIERIRF